ncbi:uncharacterized protein DNG_07042 [Cephalotrichum gorgonifer]|uniref:Uncharacterized protein n=1 Tax=Cephalotrichum gorgonifer TaxID=2041049 RepID=A0AAE8N1R8_9PEZI|nr:uncharacterized protein DNG_07042 [Cephalotrichum gorgonifer]
MKVTQSLILALAAPLVAAQDAPCSNEACTSLCNRTPSCLSTLFDPATGLCYTFSCVVDNYSAPSKFLGYQKPGGSYTCPADQPVPGDHVSPPPEEPDHSSTEAAAPPPPTVQAPSPTQGPDGTPTSLTTRVRGQTTSSSLDQAGTSTGESASRPTDGGNLGDSTGDTTNEGEGDPAAPTIILPDAAKHLGVPILSLVAAFALHLF